VSKLTNFSSDPANNQAGDRDADASASLLFPRSLELGGPLFERSRKISQRSLTCAIKQLETCRLSGPGMAVQPHLATMEGAATDAKHEAVAFLAAGGPLLPLKPNPALPFKPKEKFMRKVVFSAVFAATAVLVFIVGLTLRPPSLADISAPAKMGKISDAYAIEATIDTKALPNGDVDLGD
jgi:hypothetical protein